MCVDGEGVTAVAWLTYRKTTVQLLQFSTVGVTQNLNTGPCEAAETVSTDEKLFRRPKLLSHTIDFFFHPRPTRTEPFGARRKRLLRSRCTDWNLGKESRKWKKNRKKRNFLLQVADPNWAAVIINELISKFQAAQDKDTFTTLFCSNKTLRVHWEEKSPALINPSTKSYFLFRSSVWPKTIWSCCACAKQLGRNSQRSHCPLLLPPELFTQRQQSLDCKKCRDVDELCRSREVFKTVPNLRWGREAGSFFLLVDLTWTLDLLSVYLQLDMDLLCRPRLQQLRFNNVTDNNSNKILIKKQS